MVWIALDATAPFLQSAGPTAFPAWSVTLSVGDTERRGKHRESEIEGGKKERISRLRPNRQDIKEQDSLNA